MDNILEVRNLKVEFGTYGGTVQAVRGVSFDAKRGKTLAIVGESGCGKSVTVQSIMGLIPMPPGRITSGSVLFEGSEILGLPLREANKIRGKSIGMIFQDPMTSLNPTMTVGDQIAETLRYHDGLSRRAARERAVALLAQVQIPEAELRVDQYPHEFSGGMRQRVMIAMAIACKPAVLIADEPTTALDVTVQAEVLGVLKKLQRELRMSIILITHDLGVVAKMADDVAVMYAGQIVEAGTAEEIFYRSSHPYTVGLKAAMPQATETVVEFGQTASRKKRLLPIEGAPPDLFMPPQGCGYFDRCPHAMNVCRTERPELWRVEGPAAGLAESPADGSEPSPHQSRCWLHHAKAPAMPAGIFEGERVNP